MDGPWIDTQRDIKAFGFSGGRILLSHDKAKTWGKYDLVEFGDRSGVRVNPPNSDGWFPAGLRTKWLDRAEVLFLKPKV